MSLLAPAALGLGLLAVPIILLYMLRLRRRPQIVSSTFLWRELVRDQSANAPWQRLKRNWLMILQLILLAALVLALARPMIRTAIPAAENTIILLDASASMQATDMASGRTRFDVARDEVERIGWASGQTTLIVAGRTPSVLLAASTDPTQLRTVLGQTAAESTSADWAAAIALAAASAQGLSNPNFVIVSDGNLPESLPGLPGEVEFISIGQAADNLTIAAMAPRQTTTGNAALLVRVKNTGPENQQTLVSLYRDGSLFDSRRVNLGPTEEVSLNWDLSAQNGVMEARLGPNTDSNDYLPLDDNAWALLEGNGLRRILLISDGNLFLERVFTILPGYELFRVDSTTGAELLTESDINGQQYDLVVFDSLPLPSSLPETNIIIFNPQMAVQTADGAQPAGNSSSMNSLHVTGTFTNTTPTRVTAHPILNDVDWGTINVGQAQQLNAPGWQTLVDTDMGPLLLFNENGNYRAVTFAFDLRQSDLPLQIAFPIIMANITTWLNPGRIVGNEGDLHTGDSVILTPDNRAEVIIIELPDESRWETAANTGGSNILFNDTQQPGVYRIYSRSPQGDINPAGAFVVNFFNEMESSIQPSESIRLAQTEVSAKPDALTGQREIWPWLLALGLGILLLEWAASYRWPTRPTLFKTQ